MGYNTTVIVENDALGQIEKDTNFGKNLAQAILHKSVVPCNQSIDVPAGNHCNAASVVEQHDSNFTVIVAVGGGYGTVIGTKSGYTHHTDEEKLNILQSLATDMGYTLHKKKMQKKMRKGLYVG